MTHRPDFDELVGPEVERDERERLLRVHELLLQAGPPPELSPDIERPTLALTLQRRPRPARRRMTLLAAAIAVVAAVFLAGYATGNHHGNGPAGHTLSLVGTKAAPGALASLQVEPADAAGNWPMKLAVTGLPKLPPQGYYTVYLVRNGKAFAPCGTFVVAGKAHGTLVWLNAPYRLEAGDTWVVTKQLPGHHEAGTVVLRPNA
ncbi:MAG: hypothetical protein QOI27_1733 [Gaiellaceae bacterium]|nr:hypothetical protein [Gaiellaceae bacterium]